MYVKLNILKTTSMSMNVLLKGLSYNFERLTQKCMTVYDTVTELPVACPDFDETYEVDHTTGIYIFSQPSFGHENVTLLPSVMYFPYGGTYNVEFSVVDGANLGVGSYELLTSIIDSILQRNCSSTLVVRGLNSYFCTDHSVIKYSQRGDFKYCKSKRKGQGWEENRMVRIFPPSLSEKKEKHCAFTAH